MSSKSDNTFEINADDINVEDIMRKIRENIAKRKASGAYTEEDERRLSSTYGPPEMTIHCENPYLAYINNNWDVQYKNYNISSHRRLIGPVLVKGRQIVNGEVRRYVDPIILKQIDYNFNIMHAIKSNNEGLNALMSDLRMTRLELNDKIMEKTRENEEKITRYIDEKTRENEEKITRYIDEKTRENEEKITRYIDEKISQLWETSSHEINKKIENIFFRVESDIKNKAWLAKIISGQLDKLNKGYIDKGYTIAYSKLENENLINYIDFEQKFRGPYIEIRQRQSIFIDYYRGCKNVLDIGCGRGEFLELCSDNGINATGIDIDEGMIHYCKSRGFNVKLVDAISYLETLEDESLDGIFMDQVIEHLDPRYVVKLLVLCNKKLKTGSCAIIETVNPLCLLAFVNFYIDMTHKRPMHPETLKFLMEYSGFKEISLKFSSPYNDEVRLKKIACDPSFSEKEKDLIASYNYNIDKLNDLIYGSQDYAVIAKK